MTYPISGCCFVKDTFVGAFCIFESMASLLPLVDEYVVMDLGSTDGTLARLEQIAAANPRVKLKRGKFPTVDAGAFATLANDLMRDHCENDVCWYHQADEIWHQDLLRLTRDRFERGERDLSFWRIQYRDNFQRIKWHPHVVHRVGRKGKRFNFVGDGMNTDRSMEPPLCSDYDGGYFMRWGQMDKDGEFQGRGYERQMVLDVSLVGGFRDNIVERRALHAPFWHEEPHVEGIPASQWRARAMANPDWVAETSPYDLPFVMHWHLGRTRYELRDTLFEALCDDDTAGMVGL